MVCLGVLWCLLVCVGVCVLVCVVCVACVLVCVGVCRCVCRCVCWWRCLWSSITTLPQSIVIHLHRTGRNSCLICARWRTLNGILPLAAIQQRARYPTRFGQDPGVPPRCCKKSRPTAALASEASFPIFKFPCLFFSVLYMARSSFCAFLLWDSAPGISYVPAFLLFGSG